MSVRNINQGYYDLPEIITPTTLTFTGTATITVPVIFRTINGTVQLYINNFNLTCTDNGYLTTTIPTQFLKPSSTATLIVNTLAIVGIDYTNGSFTLNMATGELRIYPDTIQIKFWITGSTCGLYENATLVWNMI